MRADSNQPFRARAAFARAFLAALLLAIGGNALSLPGKRFVGHYDFGYAIRGDRAARPAQVFDDGSGKIYLEARPNQPMPAVFAGKELALLVLQPEGQYFTARTAASEFTLVLGGARAVVRRGDAALGDEVLLPQDEGGRQPVAADGELPTGIDDSVAASQRTLLHEQPVVFPPGGAALRPEVLDALSALVVRIGHTAVVTVVGRSDAGDDEPLATARAQALRNALLARGVAASRIELTEDTSRSAPGMAAASVLRWHTPSTGGAPALASFDILPTDRNIAVAVRRWARASGYEIAWDVDWEAPVNGALRLEAASFPEAVRQVVSGLRAQGYPVQARMPTGRSIRFTSADDETPFLHVTKASR